MEILKAKKREAAAQPAMVDGEMRRPRTVLTWGRPDKYRLGATEFVRAPGGPRPTEPTDGLARRAART